LRSCHQNRGSRQAPSPGPSLLPSKKLADSIRSASVSTSKFVAGGDRCGGLLRSLQRRGDDGDDVAVGQRVSPPLGPAELLCRTTGIRAVARRARRRGCTPHRGGSGGRGSVRPSGRASPWLQSRPYGPREAKRRRSGQTRRRRAPPRRTTLRRHCRAGRRRRPAAHGKNGAKRHVSLARADAKSVTGASPKNTLSMFAGPAGSDVAHRLRSEPGIAGRPVGRHWHRARHTPRLSAARSVASPAATATGLPDSVPA